MLLDSAHLQEEDARRANRGGWSKHHPALPLYDAAQARRAIAKIVAVAAGRSLRIGRVKVDFTPVGHLLGAAALSVHGDGLVLVFSGDLGRSDDILMPAPKQVAQADVLLVESTYGNRTHPERRCAGPTRCGDPRDRAARWQRAATVLRSGPRAGAAAGVAAAARRRRDPARPADRARQPDGAHRHRVVPAASPLAAHRSRARPSTLTDGVTLVQTAQQSQRLTQQPLAQGGDLRPAAWPRVAACCTTSRRWRRTRATTSSFPASRSAARAVRTWWPAQGT